MGREIRRVPPDWKHPKDRDGHYQPMHDTFYDDAVAEWEEGFLLWEKGEHPDQEDHMEFWESHGDPPDLEYHLAQKWTKEEACCFQIYETVSEGTPTSPVFKTKKDLIQWLVQQGYSHKAATRFAETEWALSGVVVDGKAAMGISSYDILPEKKEAPCPE